MTLTEADVIAAVKGYTYLSVQNAAEATASTNMSADLLYANGSENQGNFSLFYADAATKVTADAISRELTLTDTQLKHAYAYLLQHYYETKFRDWDAEATSIGTDITKRTKGSLTSGWAAYIALWKEAERENVSSVEDTTIIRHADDINYPPEFINSSDLDTDVDVM